MELCVQFMIVNCEGVEMKRVLKMTGCFAGLVCADLAALVRFRTYQAKESPKTPFALKHFSTLAIQHKANDYTSASVVYLKYLSNQI